MICPKCKELGMKSCVYSDGGYSTLLEWTPYWDENGNYVTNDPNTHSWHYHCSNGHKFVEAQSRGISNIIVIEDNPNPEVKVGM